MFDDDGLVERFAALVPRMRQGSRQSWVMFFDAVDAKLGGRIVMAAPCTFISRDLPEAGFRTEMFRDLE